MSAEHKTTGWQPIATAPFDGRKILVACNGTVWIDSQRLGKHAGPSRGGMPTTGREFAGCGGEMPRHWMPLPEAPSYGR